MNVSGLVFEPRLSKRYDEFITQLGALLATPQTTPPCDNKPPGEDASTAAPRFPRAVSWTEDGGGEGRRTDDKAEC